MFVYWHISDTNVMECDLQMLGILIITETQINNKSLYIPMGALCDYDFISEKKFYNKLH